MPTHRFHSLSAGGRRHGRRGFSIIELLVAIIIIGILVAILVPIVSNRAEQARVARANSDLENIVESLQRQVVDTGYYTRLFALDDVLFGEAALDGSGSVSFARPRNPNDIADGLTDYLGPQSYYQFPDANSLFIDPRTGLFAGVNPTTLTYQGTPTRQDIIVRLASNESRYDTSSGRWGGPYLAFRADRNTINNITAPNGIPDDPWGNDYLLFSRSGLFLEPLGLLVQSVAVSPNGQGLVQGATYDTRVFDRGTVVSLGPNGLPGNGDPVSVDGRFGRGDDLFRSMGGN